MHTRRDLFTTVAAAALSRAGTPGANLRRIRVGTPIPMDDNQGDTWAPALAPDGSVYSPSDDTKGFHKAAESNVAFNRITGRDPSKLSGATVNPMRDYGKSGEKAADRCTWKSSGCLFLDGALYLVVARHCYGEDSGDARRRQTARNASIVKSTDFGLTWTRPQSENYQEPMFPGSRFATPYFINYGTESTGVDGSRRHVYAVSNNGFWDCGDDFILGRVLRSNIGRLRGADWEYFGGGDAQRASSWSGRSADAKPLLERPGKCGMTGPAYLAGHRRYLLVNWYYPAGGGKMPNAATHTIWEFFDAPHPWGPWTLVGTYDSSPAGYYSPEVWPLFQSGETIFVVTAGNWNSPEHYRLTLVPLMIG